MECKKIKNTFLGRLAECLGLGTRQKLGKNCRNFPTLPSAKSQTLSKDFFLKKKISLPSALQEALSAKCFKKNLCQVPCGRHSANIFFKKNSLPSALWEALSEGFSKKIFVKCLARGTRQRFFKKVITFFVECPAGGTR
jgi:hypothetical protein